MLVYRNGTIDIHEFVSLWKYIQDWKGCFDRYVQSGKYSDNYLFDFCVTFFTLYQGFSLLEVNLVSVC